MNCNDTMTFLKERERICGVYLGKCKLCPLYNFSCALRTVNAKEDEYKTILDAVQKWSDEHPKKTYKEDFLEKFPNARKFLGRPKVCREYVYGGSLDNCLNGYAGDCEKCWNEPMRNA